MRPQRVQVFAIGRPRAGTPKADRRYRVKWRIDGRDRTRSFKTRAEADRLRAGLLAAVERGDRFDPSTGEPEGWTVAPLTWFEWSQQWLEVKWQQWAGNSRRSAVESLVAITPLMTRAGAAEPPEDLAGWLRMHGYLPGAPEWRQPHPWLRRWSVPLAEISPELLERVLTAVSTRRDGRPASAEVSRRRKNALGAGLRAAVRRGLLAENPMERIEWRTPERSISVDVATLPAFSDVCEIVDLVAARTTGSARYAALFASVGMAGLRPSEAIGLDVDDLELPSTGWGHARLRGATTSPGVRYSTSGEVRERKALKQRAEGTIREVPLPAELVRRLHGHLDRFPPVDGVVFANGSGKPATSTNYTPAWGRARRQLWPDGHPLAGTVVYDLRHSAATTMLRAHVPPAEVARRLGHSVDVLLRIYAGVFEDERDRSNALIDAELDRHRRR